MKISSYVLTIVLVTALLFGISPSLAAKGKPGGGGGTPPPAFGIPEIAFVNNGNALMVLDKDRNIKTLISGTGDGSLIASPSWAPSGDRIAFSSTLGGTGWQLYVIDADGKNLTRLAPIEGMLSEPAWSPDGQWIAYTGGNPTRNDKDIFVIDVSCAESGSSNCVFHFDTTGYRENGVTWSPYGDGLAAKALLEGFSPVTTELVTYTFTDFPFPVLGPPSVLTASTLSKAEGEGNLPSPAWSKEDDQWIAVLSRNADFNGDLFLIDTDTLDAFNLTNCAECDNLEQPSWSPCNSKMVVSTRDPNNRKNTNYSTLAFLDIQYDSWGKPKLQIPITYLPRQSQSDSYSSPDWKRGLCQ